MSENWTPAALILVRLRLGGARTTRLAGSVVTEPYKFVTVTV
jgi:hypothetical protein